MKVVNILSGASKGGAEKFFERFCIALDRYKNIEQIVIFRKDSERIKLFKKYSFRSIGLNFYNNFDFFTKYKIKRILEDYKPQIIVSWMNRASMMLPEIEAEKLFIGRLGGYYKLKNYTKCDYLIANTNGIKDFIIEQGWDSEKVIYLPNFVNKPSADKLCKKHFKIPKQKTIILGVGRFHRNKGFDILIKSLSLNKDCFLFLVGEGILKKFYLDLARKIGVIDRLLIFDWTNNISKFYNSADILVCSSRIEPLGNIILEGWAHEIPVISSDIMGPKELISHNVNGLKFEKENLSDLDRCIKKLKNNKILRKKISKGGFKTYYDNFSEKVVMEKFLSFFKKIID